MTISLPPESWAKAACALDDATFRKRVKRCNDPERLRATLKREDTRPYETRTDRIGLLNQRLQKLQG